MSGAVSGWQRAANGAALTMVREQYIDKVRDGLAAMADARMNDVKWVDGIPTKRGNTANSGFRVEGFFRSPPKPARFMVHLPRKLQDVPFSTNLKMVVETDQKVFRRTDYD